MTHQPPRRPRTDGHRPNPKKPEQPWIVPSGPGDAARRTVAVGVPAIERRRIPRGPSIKLPPLRSHDPLIWMTAVGITLAGALWWTLQPTPYSPDAMPIALQNTWRTSHPRYANATLRITGSTIAFIVPDTSSQRPGDLMEMRHPVVGLRGAPRGDTTDLTLTYGTKGDEVELSARLIAGQTPSLTFTHPDGLTWVPASSSR